VLDPNEVGPVDPRALGEFVIADIGLVGRAVLTLLFISRSYSFRVAYH